jgi:hypothetical protein
MRFHNRVSIAGNLTHYDHLKRTFVPSAASCAMDSEPTFAAFDIEKLGRSPERPLSSSCPFDFALAANVSFPPLSLNAALA